MNIICKNDEHSWRIQRLDFDFSGVTIPIKEVKLSYSDPHEWSTREIDEAFKMEAIHKEIYKVLEISKDLNTFYDMIHLYLRGNCHIIGEHVIKTDLDKVNELFIEWVKLANILNQLLGFKKELIIDDKITQKWLSEFLE